MLCGLDEQRSAGRALPPSVPKSPGGRRLPVPLRRNTFVSLGPRLGTSALLVSSSDYVGPLEFTLHFPLCALEPCPHVPGCCLTIFLFFFSSRRVKEIARTTHTHTPRGFSRAHKKKHGAHFCPSFWAVVFNEEISVQNGIFFFNNTLALTRGSWFQITPRTGVAKMILRSATSNWHHLQQILYGPKNYTSSLLRRSLIAHS